MIKLFTDVATSDTRLLLTLFKITHTVTEIVTKMSFDILKRQPEKAKNAL